MTKLIRARGGRGSAEEAWNELPRTLPFIPSDRSNRAQLEEGRWEWSWGESKPLSEH